MINVLISEDELTISSVEAMLSDAGSGGKVYFVGAVRNVTKGKKVTSLEFECYEPMALKEMNSIALQAQAKWPINNIVIHHRIGKLAVGEYPVIIGAASAHRGDAFAACQYMIDRLKETVPIWKKEQFIDGEIWVSAHP